MFRNCPIEHMCIAGKMRACGLEQRDVMSCQVIERKREQEQPGIFDARLSEYSGTTEVITAYFV